MSIVAIETKIVKIIVRTTVTGLLNRLCILIDRRRENRVKEASKTIIIVRSVRCERDGTAKRWSTEKVVECVVSGARWPGCGGSDTWAWATKEVVEEKALKPKRRVGEMMLHKRISLLTCALKMIKEKIKSFPMAFITLFVTQWLWKNEWIEFLEIWYKILLFLVSTHKKSMNWIMFFNSFSFSMSEYCGGKQSSKSLLIVLKKSILSDLAQPTCVSVFALKKSRQTSISCWFYKPARRLHSRCLRNLYESLSYFRHFSLEIDWIKIADKFNL